MSGHIRSVETDECLSFGSQVIFCLLLTVYCLGLEVVIGIDSRDRTRVSTSGSEANHLSLLEICEN